MAKISCMQYFSEINGYILFWDIGLLLCNSVLSTVVGYDVKPKAK